MIFTIVNADIELKRFKELSTRPAKGLGGAKGAIQIVIGIKAHIN